MEGSPDRGGLPRYPIKTVILVAFLLLAFQGVAEVIRRIAFLRGRIPEPGAPHEPHQGEVL
jgi:TRAP-type mannitol/chloroaromatic compound transport system permease small subunit